MSGHLGSKEFPVLIFSAVGTKIDFVQYAVCTIKFTKNKNFELISGRFVNKSAEYETEWLKTTWTVVFKHPNMRHTQTVFFQQRV